MQRRQLIALFDFDSTLFDLKGFITALPRAVEEEFGAEYGIEASAFAAGIPKFYVGTIGYDVDAHLLHHGVKLESGTAKSRLISRILEVHRRLTGQPSLLFPDVPAALTRIKSSPGTDLAIMTVNLKRGYEFKLALCGGHLDDIPAWVVDTNKGLLLARLWAKRLVYAGVEYDKAMVVDDHPSQIEAVPNSPRITRLQIVREGQKYPANTRGIRIIGSVLEAAA